VRDAIKELVTFLEGGTHSKEEIQEELDRVTQAINDLQGDFEEGGSEIETVARDSIGTTIEEILKVFKVEIDIETAIRERDW
jgi:biotin operon repressor